MIPKHVSFLVRWWTCWGLLLIPVGLSAQYRDTRVTVQVEKEWKLNKKLRFSLEEQLQLTPDLGAMPFLQRGTDPDFADISFLDPVFYCTDANTSGNRRSGTDDDDDDDDDDDNDDDDDDDDDNDDDDDDDDDDNDDDDGNGTGGTIPDNTDPTDPGGEPLDDDDSNTDDDADTDDDTDDGPAVPEYVCFLGDSTSGEPGGSGSMEDRPWIELRSATAASLVWRFSKTWRLSAGYRYNLRPDTDTHVMFTELAARRQTDTKRWTLDSRLRAFHETGYFRDEWRGRYFATLRVRGTLAVGMVEPFAESEVVYRISQENGGFNRYRIGGGVNLKLGDDHRLRFQYNHQQRFFSSSEGRAGSFAIGYAYEL
ncbi:MAG: DUF2490 domain-containing protein [Bacteroidia bacterium]|nr:DUF2490 domain-containing protein [Bacteroidia bacterium]